MDKYETQQSPIASDTSVASEDEIQPKPKKKNKKSVERELRLLMPDYRPSRKPWKTHGDEGKNSFYESIFHVWKQIFDHVCQIEYIY
jgi:hypothetical protein